MGIPSFQEALEVTRATYENEAAIPDNIPFDVAWNTLERVVEYWESAGFIPFQFELPEGVPK